VLAHPGSSTASAKERQRDDEAMRLVIHRAMSVVFVASKFAGRVAEVFRAVARRVPSKSYVSQKNKNTANTTLMKARARMSIRVMSSVLKAAHRK
jgi:hypothetical protein